MFRFSSRISTRRIAEFACVAVIAAAGWVVFGGWAGSSQTMTRPARSTAEPPAALPPHELRVARAAFDAFGLSVEAGDWRPYMALMSPEVEFTLPIMGLWRGPHRGAAAAEEYHRWRWEDLRMRSPVMLDSITSNAATRTAAFEFRIDGSILGDVPVKHHAVYFFEVEGGKVRRFREYNGENYEAEAKLAARGLGGVYGQPPEPVEKLAPRAGALSSQPMSRADYSVAASAFAAYADALETGRPEPFLALLGPDATFTTAHQGRWRGVKRGRATAAELLRWHRETLAFRGRVSPGPVTANARTVGFEYRLDGTVRNVPLSDPRAIFFDVADGRVTGFREFHGASGETVESFRGTPQERLFSPRVRPTATGGL